MANETAGSPQTEAANQYPVPTSGSQKYEIKLDDGRKLHIEADSQETAIAGAQHFLKNNRKRREASTVIVLADSSEWGG
jgi:hypothetical protein